MPPAAAKKSVSFRSGFLLVACHKEASLGLFGSDRSIAALKVYSQSENSEADSQGMCPNLTCCFCVFAEKVPGGHQHKARPCDEEWKIHTGHKDLPKVLEIWQR